MEFAERRHAGSLIRVGREARGWRQSDLGVHLACSQSTVSRLEQGLCPSICPCSSRPRTWSAFPSRS
ncbi:multiprotein-bridging factor 1 family protein [Streptomyces sp. NPDC056402]|uniref:helix-turn-helix domain-containing protein n=1 Tax=Streptomyces sp. NPDC056402 TaxID=3345810 RepID=UPI0035D80DF2